MLYYLWCLFLYLLGYNQDDDRPPPISAGRVPDLTKEITRLDEVCVHSGEFTDIWRVGWSYEGSRGKVYAAKVVREVVPDNARRERVTRRLNEIYQLWHHLSKEEHPNISPCYGVTQGFGSFPSAIVPFYSNSNALAYTLKNRNADKRRILADAAAGLAFLHALPKKITHGNMKASNILITDDGHACISDTRLYLVVSQSDFTTAYIAGSCRWAAPEVMDPPETDNNDDDDFALATTTEADVYAFGMTMIEIYSGKHPFVHKRNDATVVLEVMKGSRPFRPETSELTDDLWDIIQKCWRTDPTARPTITDVFTQLKAGP